MGAVEDIMAAVILMFIFLIGGIIYMTSFAQDAAGGMGVKRDVFFDDSYINNLNNMLKITEPVSGRSMGVLMADAVYYRNDTLVFNDEPINVTQRIDELLNMSFGHARYFLEVKPRIIEVSMNFIIDGSDSLTDERQQLADNLLTIILRVEKKLNETNAGYRYKVAMTKNPVQANIYILGEKAELCEVFDTMHDPRNLVRCQVIGSRELYLRNATANASTTFINNTRYNLDAFLAYYNMTPPFGFEWVADNTSYYAPEIEYFSADYGYGTAYASNFDARMTLSHMTLLFPMSDELSTSSIADECFLIRQGMNAWGAWVDCSLCRDDCPAERSLTSITKGIEVARDNSHIINPIFSFSCDYNYLSDYNIAYDMHHGSSGTTNACSLAACEGCELDSEGNVCFHPQCSQITLSHMEQMANATSGKVINLADIATMDINITDTINENIEQYALRIGMRLEHAQRDVVEVTQPLPNGELVDIRLWVYKN